MSHRGAWIGLFTVAVMLVSACGSSASSDPTSGPPEPESFYGGSPEEACAATYEPGSPRPTVDSFAVLRDQNGYSLCVGPVLLASSALEQASSSPIDGFGFAVGLVFTSAGIDEFNSAAQRCFERTAQCPSQRLALVLNGQVITAPTLQSHEFERDQIVISGDFSGAEAELIAEQIRLSITSDSSVLRFRPVILDLGPGE